MNALGEWIGEQMRARALTELRGMSKERLRHLWDTIGEDSFSEGYDCADIHLVMNETGDGEYCAV